MEKVSTEEIIARARRILTFMRAERLFEMLKIEHYTNRHLESVMRFLESESDDPKELLDLLGEWDSKDLRIATRFIDQNKEFGTLKA